MIKHLLVSNLAVTRWLLMLLPVLLVAACGAEAPPRVARAAPTPSPYATRTPTPVTLPTLAIDPTALAEPAEPIPTALVAVESTVTAPDAVAQGDPRSLGDPNAPITIVEYSDFQ